MVVKEHKIEELTINVERVKKLIETDAPNLLIINELKLIKESCEKAIEELETLYKNKEIIAPPSKSSVANVYF